MIISHRKKFIFIHIYKTGGTSVSSALISHARFRDRISNEFYLTKTAIDAVNRICNLYDQGNQWFNGIHKHARAIEIKDYLGEDKYRSYYKFAFVRNPWDWQISLYEYIRKHKYHRQNRTANVLSFKDFLKTNTEKCNFCQLDFITDTNGEMIVDWIGRFECLQEDFNQILDRLNLAPRQLKNINSSNRRRNYREYYDEESAQLVFDFFQRDIEYFNYQF